MRHAPSLLAVLLLAAPARADAPASWDAFRAAVEAACLRLVPGEAPVEATVEVNPFGSASYGVALVTLASEAGADRVACVFDKATGEAELTAPFAGAPGDAP